MEEEVFEIESAWTTQGSIIHRNSSILFEKLNNHIIESIERE